MIVPAQIDGEVLPIHGIAGGSALALLESPSPGLTPAQRELRQIVLDSVTLCLMLGKPQHSGNSAHPFRRLAGAVESRTINAGSVII